MSKRWIGSSLAVAAVLWCAGCAAPPGVTQLRSSQVADYLRKYGMKLDPEMFDYWQDLRGQTLYFASPLADSIVLIRAGRTQPMVVRSNDVAVFEPSWVDPDGKCWYLPKWARASELN